MISVISSFSKPEFLVKINLNANIPDSLPAVMVGDERVGDFLHRYK